MSIHKLVAKQRIESPAQKALVSLLETAGHLARALEEVCAAHGITHDQYNVLRILRGVHPEGHPRYAIAERLIDRSPDVTRLLDRLEREGFVGRSRSDEDRRLSISYITDRGITLLKEIDPRILEVHERFTTRFSRDEMHQLATLCEKALPK